MKFTSFLTTFILTISTACIAHSAQRITVSNPDFNFGKITQGQIVEHIFIIRNDGDQPLSVKSVRTSCGCTAAKVSSRVIQPGTSSKIKTTFNSGGFSGKVRKTIAVATDDPKLPVTTLSLSGSVVEEITIDPRQLDFGTLKAGSTKEKTITLASNIKNGVRLSVSSVSPQFKVTPGKNFLKPGESVTITVSATPRKGDRMISGYIFIKADLPSKRDMVIPIFASVTN